MPDASPLRLGWEERAVGRSLGAALARSSAQAHALVDAARSLIAEVGPGFTVQQVAARAGMSVKTFYRSFSGRDTLLLALFEGDNRIGAEVLAERIEEYQEPVERLRQIVLGLFELSTARPHEDYIHFVMREYFRLAQAHSEEVEEVLRPFVDLIARELERAAEHGVVQLDNIRQFATALFLTTVSNLCLLVLVQDESEQAQTAQFVARFCLRGLGIDT
jgi:AcrR family transcriptional regulator